MKNNYYVYAYLNEDNNMPYYIGKGKGNRSAQYHDNVAVPEDTTKIKILHHSLNEKSALDIESRLIEFYGREDLGTGILKNKNNGATNIFGKRISERITRKKFLEKERDNLILLFKKTDCLENKKKIKSRLKNVLEDLQFILKHQSH